MPIKIINYDPKKFCAEMDERIRFRKASVLLGLFLFFFSLLVLITAIINENIVAVTAALVAVLFAVFGISNGTKSLYGLFRTNRVILHNVLSDQKEPYIYLDDEKTGKVSLMVSDSEHHLHWLSMTFKVKASTNASGPVLDFAEEVVIVPETTRGGNNNA